MEFRQALAFLDAGNADRLRAFLREHPALATERVHWGPEYFAHPPLLAFCAENPIRNGRLPANVVDVARVILEAGADVEAVQQTLALVASGRVARECRVQVPLIELLCASGADANGAMGAALTHGEFEAVEALLRLGATLDLPVAAALGRADAVRALLPDASAEARHRALALAAQHGRTEALRVLLDAGEDPNRFNPPHCHPHSTPLHQAVCYGHLEAARLLVDRGARLDVEDTMHGGTPLDWAEHCGQREIEKWLRARK